MKGSEKNTSLLPQSEVDRLLALYDAHCYAELENEAALLVQQYPDAGRAWKILGIALGIQGKDALPAMQKAAHFLPEDVSVQNNLGNAWLAAGELMAAEACYRKAISLDPDFAPALNNLGKVLYQMGKAEEAIALYRRALELQPEFSDALYNLGNALQSHGRYAEALAAYQQGAAISPDDVQMQYNLAGLLCKLEKLDESKAAYQKVISLDAKFVEGYNNLGNVLLDLKQPQEAIRQYQVALNINPLVAEIHNNLGVALQTLGQYGAAMTCYRKALALQENYIDAQSNLLYSMNCTAQHVEDRGLAEARKYGSLVGQRVRERMMAWQCEEMPNRLRIGIVSGDLRQHPVGYALENLLLHLDRNKVEAIAYPTNAKTDVLTSRIQSCFAAWRPIHGISDAEAAQMIHADGVHILVDLSGHTGHNRLPLFAWKAAPVQVSWLGYFATTGVAEMDYLMTSKVAVPQEHQGHFTERICYLPDIWLCFTPPQQSLSVNGLPALGNGWVTFGCFQRLDKISDASLAAWGEILARMPQARLRLANKELGNPHLVEPFKQRLAQRGLDPTRVMLSGAAATREEYLARYNEVDIVLDTFPYPGVTTTCEALWMGVPTLSLAGETLLSRQGAGMLVPAGLGDWVANSEEEYIAKAIQFGSDLPKLAALRANLRQQVLASPVYDAPRFARNFEAALWDMWRNRA